MWNVSIIVDEGGFGGFGAPRLKFCEKNPIFLKSKWHFILNLVDLKMNESNCTVIFTSHGSQMSFLSGCSKSRM